MKKKLLGISMLILVLFGCSEDNLTPDAENIAYDPAKVMCFSMDEITRGTPIESFSDGDAIGVFCSYTGGSDWSSGSTPSKMFNVKQTLTAGAWKYNPGEEVKWDYTTLSDKYSFFAYAPYATGTTAGGNGIVINGSSSIAGIPSLTYTVPTDVTKQPDLMVSYPVYNRVPLASAVMLKMKHALTCVSFKVKGDVGGEGITSIKIKGVSMSGKLVMDGNTIIWSNLTSANNTTEFGAGLNGGTAGSGVFNDLMSGNGYLMMIPQTLTANAKLLIKVSGETSEREISLNNTAAWVAGEKICYNVTLTPLGTVTVDRDLLYLAPKDNPSCPSNFYVFIKDKDGVSDPNLQWTLTTTEPWVRLSLSNIADFASASASLQGQGDKPVYIYTDVNTATTNRAAKIKHGAKDLITATQLGTTAMPASSLAGTIITVNRSYVGAFWKATETGERIIRIPILDAANEGAWTASVYQTDTDWISNDIVFDNTVPTTHPNDSNAEGSQVTASATVVPYASGTVANGDNIEFRIGLKNAYSSTTDPARYATVVITYANNTKAQLLFLRQGHDADYLFRQGDKDKSGNAIADDRLFAKKFSPYNLTATILDQTVVAKGGKFTAYPTQAGAFWQWANTTYIRYAWSPIGTITGWSATDPSGYWDALEADHETCPDGYRRPNDGTINWNNSSGSVSGSEFRQSLYLSPKTGTLSDGSNMVFGYYADGYFDRRSISSNTTVSINALDVAYIGMLFFNPTSNASLFFPAAGNRNSNNGVLNNAGSNCYCWSSSTNSNKNSWYLDLSSTKVNQYFSVRAFGFSIRCVSN